MFFSEKVYSCNPACHLAGRKAICCRKRYAKKLTATALTTATHAAVFEEVERFKKMGKDRF